MKNFLLTITGFILSINAFAQNWQTFNSKVKYNFSTSFVVYDSVSVRGADTLLYNFKQIQQVRAGNYPAYVLSGIGSSWVGKVIVIKPCGTNVFLNGSNDSVYIETKARLGEVFSIYANIANNQYITGRVDSIVLGKMLGVSDSLKYITLLANGNVGYGSNGDYVTSIVLSKNYGLLSTVSFFNIGYTYYSNYYNSYHIKNSSILLGNSQIQGTYSNMKIPDIYGFNVGDEFHIEEYTNGPKLQYLLNPRGYDIKSIQKVLTKAYSANQDTVIYTLDVTQNTVDPNGHFPSTYTRGIQTVKYALYDMTNPLNSVPGKVYLSGTSAKIPVNHENKDTVSVYLYSPYYSTLPCIVGDSCQPFSSPGNLIKKYYKNGQGGPYYSYNIADPSISVYIRQLVYSKKGTVETGTPYDANALAVNDQQLSAHKTRVYPNPAKDKLNIEANRSSSVSIKNMIGVEVYKGQLNNGANEINISQLASGIYFVVITTGDTTVTEKIVVE